MSSPLVIKAPEFEIKEEGKKLTKTQRKNRNRRAKKKEQRVKKAMEAVQEQTQKEELLARLHARIKNKRTPKPQYNKRQVKQLMKDLQTEMNNANISESDQTAVMNGLKSGKLRPEKILSYFKEKNNKSS